MRWNAQQLAQHLARRAVATAPATPKRQDRKPRAIRLEPSENSIHEAVVGHLRVRCRRDVSWFHVGNGERRDIATAIKLQRMGLRPGVPDLVVVIAGRLHGLELKRERGGTVSAEQLAMHQELRNAGAVVETAHGLDQALSLLQRWGAFVPGNTEGSNA